MATQVFTRIAYCKKCADEGRPFTGGLFVTVGTSQKYTVRKSKVDRVKGYVPHLFSFDEVTVGGEFNGMIRVVQCCSMHKCGVWLTMAEDNVYDISFDHAHYAYLSPVEWAAIKNVWKRPTGYELD